MSRKAMQQALYALEMQICGAGSIIHSKMAWDALKAELAKPEPEPVAWLMENRDYPPIGRMLNFKPVEGWHITWTNVPLYRKEDI